MQNGFPYLDILIFGVIAIFLIFRLKNILGTKTGLEDNHLNEKNQHKPYSNVVSLKSSKDKMRILSVENSKYIDVAHYKREDLKPGYLIKGSCVISEEQTTTIVSKKFQTKVLSNGYLEITETRRTK